jgi:hypothetical protein
MFIALLSLLLIFSSGVAASLRAASHPPSFERTGPRPFTIDVVAPEGMSEASMSEIRAEADAIWRQAGVTFEWRRATSHDGPAHPGRLYVTIDDRRRHAADNPATLGWITFVDDRPAPSIHLSRAGAEDLLLGSEGRRDGPGGIRELLIERALGRALAHELGHYLLRTKGHSRHGLMRANWPSEQLFGIRRVGFELTAEQRKAAARHVRSSLPTRPTVDISPETAPRTRR